MHNMIDPYQSLNFLPFHLQNWAIQRRTMQQSIFQHLKMLECPASMWIHLPKFSSFNVQWISNSSLDILDIWVIQLQRITALEKDCMSENNGCTWIKFYLNLFQKYFGFPFTVIVFQCIATCTSQEMNAKNLLNCCEKHASQSVSHAWHCITEAI